MTRLKNKVQLMRVYLCNRREANVLVFLSQLFRLIDQYFIMFFIEDQPERKAQQPSKIVYIYENGAAQAKFHPFKIMKKRDNFKQIKNVLGYRTLRLFNPEGAEYFEDDLEFLKSQTTLYASRGEDFDPACTFGQYELLEKLGEGGFGEVQLARHRQTSEEIAIKIIKANKASSVADIDSIFIQAETLKTLKHENIVRVHNSLTLKSMQVAIVMEYLEGGELLSFVQKNGHLTEETSILIFKQIVKAMSYCHAHGLIHRDLKLQNILLVSSSQLKIKIIDFGIARLMKSFTWEDMDIGTLPYMAPQCFDSSKADEVDGKIDVWAAGVTLFAMLTGSLPFRGNSPASTIQAIKKGKYKIPSEFMKVLSQQCKHILNKCLQVEPQNRPTMQDLLSHPWISGQSILQTESRIHPLQIVQEDEKEQRTQLKVINQNRKKEETKPKSPLVNKFMKPLSAKLSANRKKR